MDGDVEDNEEVPSAWPDVVALLGTLIIVGVFLGYTAWINKGC